jgi:hypothetical protein
MAIEKVKKHMILSRKFLSFGSFSKIKSNIPLQRHKIGGEKKTLRKRVEVDIFFCKNRGRVRFPQTKSDRLSRAPFERWSGRWFCCCCWARILNVQLNWALATISLLCEEK